jgi:hypothetical protein
METNTASGFSGFSLAAKTGAAVKTKTASNNSNTIFFIFDSFVLLLKFAG